MGSPFILHRLGTFSADNKILPIIPRLPNAFAPQIHTAANFPNFYTVIKYIEIFCLQSYSQLKALTFKGASQPAEVGCTITDYKAYLTFASYERQKGDTLPRNGL